MENEKMQYNLILLGGNSPEHQAWIYEVENELGDLFERTYVHIYKHWTERKPLIDMDYESQKLGEFAKDLKNYVIFGKSAGTLLTLKGVYEGVLKPEKCIFVGLPMPWGRSNKFKCDEWLQNYSIPTMFIQNSLDPVDSYENVETLLKKKGVLNYDLRETPGDTHGYEDFSLLRELVESFVS